MTATPIADQVATMRAGNEPKPPTVFDREQQELAANGVARVISPGSMLPDAELLDAHGKETTLLRELDGTRAVVIFYRGAWCPFCNVALNAYQATLLPALSERGVKLIAISPQRPDESLTMLEKNNLTFSVLSDPGLVLGKAAGILTAPSADARAAQLEVGFDLAQVNADGTTTLPLPTAVILDPDATVRWIDVHPDYSTRTEPAEILAALETMAD